MHNKSFIVLTALLTFSMGVWADGKVRLKDGSGANTTLTVAVDGSAAVPLTTSGTSAAIGASVALTVTPATGYTVATADVALTQTAPSSYAQAPRRSPEPPASAVVAFTGADPASLAAERTYTFTMPASGADVLVEVEARTLSIPGVTIDNDGSTVKATINVEDISELAIADDIAVDQVVLQRNFTENVCATLMLPFTVSVSNVTGAEFYTFTGVAYNSTTEKWEATATEVNRVTGTLQAGTPYIVKPTTTGLISFSGGATLNTTANSPYTTVIGDWTFQGSYLKKSWGDEDPELGKAYGFAAHSATAVDGVTAIAAGDFVRFASGAFIRPTRAYLKFTGEGKPSWNHAPSRRASSELPARISVRLIRADGTTTAVDSMTRVDDTDGNGWYTLDGMRMDSAPARKGVYIYKGKKVKR